MPSELSFIPATVFRDGTPQRLNEEQEQLKREIYERMNPRRRKFVDRIGYDNWDPFQKPNDPLDVRLDVTKRTTQQLVREFLQLKAARNEQYGNDYGRGVLECALGIVNRDEKFQGITDFCLWYHDLLKKEGHNLRNSVTTISTNILPTSRWRSRPTSSALPTTTTWAWPC